MTHILGAYKTSFKRIRDQVSLFSRKMGKSPFPIALNVPLSAPLIGLGGIDMKLRNRSQQGDRCCEVPLSYSSGVDSFWTRRALTLSVTGSGSGTASQQLSGSLVVVAFTEADDFPLFLSSLAFLPRGFQPFGP